LPSYPEYSGVAVAAQAKGRHISWQAEFLKFHGTVLAQFVLEDLGSPMGISLSRTTMNHTDLHRFITFKQAQFL
jgi:hypothetical protein